MVFVDKIKQFVTGFLATQNNNYLTTEDGKKLLIFDLAFRDRAVTDSSPWGDKTAIPASWGDKIKTS
ncbi:hypothetical protein [Caudoviricetes sp.]|nr:hypothetical protein [Caudoviricetes sp.]